MARGGKMPLPSLRKSSNPATVRSPFGREAPDARSRGGVPSEPRVPDSDAEGGRTRPPLRHTHQQGPGWGTQWAAQWGGAVPEDSLPGQKPLLSAWRGVGGACIGPLPPPAGFSAVMNPHGTELCLAYIFGIQGFSPVGFGQNLAG